MRSDVPVHQSVEENRNQPGPDRAALEIAALAMAVMKARGRAWHRVIPGWLENHPEALEDE